MGGAQEWDGPCPLEECQWVQMMVQMEGLLESVPVRMAALVERNHNSLRVRNNRSDNLQNRKARLDLLSRCYA